MLDLSRLMLSAEQSSSAPNDLGRVRLLPIGRYPVGIIELAY